MKMSIEINDNLIAKAQKLSGIQDKNQLIEKALQLFVTIESQKKLENLWDNVEFDEA